MKPGFYPDMTAAEYHGDPAPTPSLSSSIAKVMLNQTPRHAWFAHPRLNPTYEASDDAKFDLGSVCHELLLGKGGGFEVIQANDWRTKAAQERRDEARKAGMTAILEKDFERAKAMADYALNRLLDVGINMAAFERETPYFWQDQGAWCRAMTDAMDRTNYVVIDIKTTEVGLSDDSIARTIDSLGYDLSAGHYIRGLESLIPESAGRWKFFWAFIEASEPHEVRVLQANRTTLEIGDRKAATAIAKFARCLKAGQWHGWPAEITEIGLKDFAIDRWINRERDDPDCQIAQFSSAVRPVDRPESKLVFGAG